MALAACQGGSRPAAIVEHGVGDWRVSALGLGDARSDTTACLSRHLAGWLPPPDGQRLKTMVFASHPLVTTAQQPPLLRAVRGPDTLWLPLAADGQAWVWQRETSPQWLAFAPPPPAVRDALSRCWAAR